MIKDIFKSFVLLSLFSFVLNFNLVAKSQDEPMVGDFFAQQEKQAERENKQAKSGSVDSESMVGDFFVQQEEEAEVKSKQDVSTSAPSKGLKQTATGMKTTATKELTKGLVSGRKNLESGVSSGMETASKKLGETKESISSALTRQKDETQKERALRLSKGASAGVKGTSEKVTEFLKSDGGTTKEALTEARDETLDAVDSTVTGVKETVGSFASLFRKKQPELSQQQESLQLMKVDRPPLYLNEPVNLYFSKWRKEGKPSYLDTSGGVLGINQSPDETSQLILIDPFSEGAVAQDGVPSVINYYEILDVTENAPVEEIRTAYKKLALIYHPDKGGDRETFEKIYTAYATLSDPEKRKIYEIERKSKPGSKVLRSGSLVLLYNPVTSSYIKMGDKKLVTAEQLSSVPTADAFKWYVFDLGQIDPKILTKAGKDFLEGKIKGMPFGNIIVDSATVAMCNFSVTSKANNEHRWLRLPSQGVFKSKTPKLAPELQNKIGTQEMLVIEKAVQAPIPGQAPMIEYPSLDEISAIEIETTSEVPMIEDKPAVDELPELPRVPTMEDAVSSSDGALVEAKGKLDSFKNKSEFSKEDKLELFRQEAEVAGLESKVAYDKLINFGTKVANYIEACIAVIEKQPVDVAKKLEAIVSENIVGVTNITRDLDLDNLKKEKNQNKTAAELLQLRIDLGLAPKTLPREPAASLATTPAGVKPQDSGLMAAIRATRKDVEETKEETKEDAKVETKENAEEPASTGPPAALQATPAVAPPPAPAPAPPPPPLPAPKGTSASAVKTDGAKTPPPGLLDAIQKGTTLKKAPEAKVKVDSNAGMLAAIKALRTEKGEPVTGLKHVEKSVVAPAAKTESGDTTSQMAEGDVLRKVLAARRGSVADDDDDDDDDDEWDD